MSSGITPEQADVLEATKSMTMQQMHEFFLWQSVQAGESADAALEHEQLVESFYKAEKAKTEASRRIAGEHFTGTTELTWEDLAAAKQSYLVHDLVPDEAIVFLVAVGNIGKTFAYLDMVCRMACGMPWLGKQTRQAKTLDDLKPWLFIVDGANMSKDESTERVREVANRGAVELLVWDTYAATSGVAKEEDSPMNSETTNRVAAIRSGASNLFIQHPRKAEERSDSPGHAR